MEISMLKDVTLLLNAVGVGNCFLLSMAYLRRKAPGSPTAKPLLSALFFVIGIVILNTIFNLSGYSRQLSGFEPISNAMAFAIAPLLYLYVCNLEGRKTHTLRSGHLAHFYAYLGITVLSISFPHSTFGQWGLRFVDSLAMISLWNLHFLAYLVAIIHRFWKSPKYFGWTAQLLVWGVGSIWFLNFSFYLFRLWIGPLPIVVYLNITLLFSALTVYLFYHKISLTEARRIRKKRKKPSAVGKDLIVAAIRRHRYYRDPDLDIRTLSGHLRLPYHELSTWINRNYDQNFNTFINRFRIEEVSEALKTQQHQSYTIMGLAQQAGFKSASAFYAAFKKEKGTTPIDFLKRLA
ncbi:helix-turn-helix domain-containing protein [Flavobacteriaceae bacterium 3-367]|uniref:helix-turn-helix domain-containing protein n=1 Tax=Eudoraea algarum TaxID=3417568 RepID=UPI00327E119E